MAYIARLPMHERPKEGDLSITNERGETLQLLDPSYANDREKLQEKLDKLDFDHTPLQNNSPLSLRGTVTLIKIPNSPANAMTSFELSLFDNHSGQRLEWLSAPQFTLYYVPSHAVKTPYSIPNPQKASVAPTLESRFADDTHMSVLFKNEKPWPFAEVGLQFIYVILKESRNSQAVQRSRGRHGWHRVDNNIRAFFVICGAAIVMFQTEENPRFRSIQGATVPMFTKGIQKTG